MDATIKIKDGKLVFDYGTISFVVKVDAKEALDKIRKITQSLSALID